MYSPQRDKRRYFPSDKARYYHDDRVILEQRYNFTFNEKLLEMRIRKQMKTVFHGLNMLLLVLI